MVLSNTALSLSLSVSLSLSFSLFLCHNPTHAFYVESVKLLLVVCNLT
jgi:hypothetical protein